MKTELVSNWKAQLLSLSQRIQKFVLEAENFFYLKSGKIF